MILFSLVSVNNLSYNCFLLNDLQSFNIKVCMLFSFGCFLLFLSLIIASNISVSIAIIMIHTKVLYHETVFMVQDL